MWRLRELTKRYGAITALNDCNLKIGRGEVLGLLGPNGAGKSTLLRLLLAFLEPTHGRATIDGLNVFEQSVEVHRRVSYLPGDVRLFRAMNGRGFLRFYDDLRSEFSFARALEIVERLQLDIKRRISAMSTGMRQKLALAATLAVDAPLVILDEPTANLDPNIRHEVGLLVREIRDDGRTVLFSSHVLSEVEQSCDRVIILREGSVAHNQVLADLRMQHRIVARLDQPFSGVPAELESSIANLQTSQHWLQLETDGELAPLLGWLAELNLEEIHIEPFGLQGVYHRYHPPIHQDELHSRERVACVPEPNY